MKNLFIALAFIFPIVSVAQKAIIEVEGLGTSKTIPEELVISIPVKIERDSYTRCSQDFIEKVEKLQKKLISIGLDKVKSNNISVRENYVYDGNKRKKQGYTGNTQVQVTEKYDPNKLGEVIGILEQEAFQFNYYTNFKISEAKQEKLNEEALRNAVSNARKKAIILSESAGKKLGVLKKIEHIETGGWTVYPPVSAYEAGNVTFQSERKSNVNLDPQGISDS